MYMYVCINMSDNLWLYSTLLTFDIDMHLGVKSS